MRLWSFRLGFAALKTIAEPATRPIEPEPISGCRAPERRGRLTTIELLPGCEHKYLLLFLGETRHGLEDETAVVRLVDHRRGSGFGRGSFCEGQLAALPA